MPKTPTPLRAWMNSATPADKAQLAKLAFTSVNHLHQLAGEHRQAGASLARRIERAVEKLGGPPVPRESLSPGCKECDYLKRCR